MRCMNDANLRALGRIAAIRPHWVAVRNAREAVGLEGRVLLHPGPRQLDSAPLPQPMRNAAMLPCLHEKWAASEREAEELLASGAVRMEPSFSRDVAIPLVAMVSPKTTLAEIADGKQRYYAFLGTGGGPQLRFGARDPAILEKLTPPPPPPPTPPPPPPPPPAPPPPPP